MTALARTETRRHRWPLVALTLVVTLITAGVLTAAAGARRTASVYDRFLAWSHAATAVVGVSSPELANDPAAVTDLLARVRTLDGVNAVRVDRSVGLLVETKYDFILQTPLTDHEPPIARPLLVDGRWPDPAEVLEVTINEAAADELGIGTGDTFRAPVMPPSAWADVFRGVTNALKDGIALGQALDLRVVGVTRDESSLNTGSTANPTALGSPGLTAAHPEAGALGVLLWLDADTERLSMDELRSIAVQAADGNEGLVWSFSGTARGPSETAFRWIAAGLAVFAAVALIAGLLVMVQTNLRQLQLSRPSTEVAAALGMSRPAVTAAVVLPTALASIAGVVIGTGGAYLLSNRFPMSVARRAEVDRGFRWDVTVHVGLAVALGAVIVAATTLLGLHQTRRHGPPPPLKTTRWSMLRLHLRPDAAYGTSAVLDSAAAGRVGARSWTALTGSVVALAGIVAVAVFEANRTDAATSPARYGWTWDLKPDLIVDDPTVIVSRLVEDQRLASVGGFFCESQELGGAVAPVCAFLSAKGTIGPTMLSGRPPAADAEVALGKDTARRLDVSVGEWVELSDITGAKRPFTVVGVAAIPTLAGNERPAQGVLVTADALETLRGGPVIDAKGSANLLLTVAPGSAPREVAAELAAEYPELSFPRGYSYPEPPELVQQLERLRPSLVALALFLAALGTIGLAHFLALSTRRRRGELAVMQAIGFRPGQVRSTVVWQAATVGVIGVVVGVPLGLLFGRWAWRLAVRDLGMAEQLTWPVVVIAGLALVAMVASVLVAVLPGALATRSRPGVTLRAE